MQIHIVQEFDNINVYASSIFFGFVIIMLMKTNPAPVNIGISAWYSLIVSAYRVYQNRISYINTVWN